MSTSEFSSTDTSIDTPPLGHIQAVAGASDEQSEAPVPKKAIAAAVAGNALEFYDFVIYSFFAVYIGQAFFPAENEFGKLLAALATYGVGFLTRPFGGVLIGAFADRVGRKPAMILTVALITIGTMGMALTPGYETIGVAAPIIVVLCRLVQGIALGGEVGPASALLIEAAPRNKRGLYSSWQIASQGLAIGVGGIVAIQVSYFLSEDELRTWGWRIPFFVSLLLIPIAIYIRRALPETLEHGGSKADTMPFVASVRKYRKLILLGIFVMISAAVTAQVGNYMTTYAIHTLKLPASIAQTATFIGGLMMFLGGLLADKYGRRATMIAPRLLLTLSIVPLFYLLDASPSIWTLLITTAMITGIGAISSAPALTAIPESMPLAFRATGTSLIYAIGVAIFGGTAQFIIAWLTHHFGAASPAYYVVAVSVVSLLGMLAMPETKDVDVRK